VSHKTNLPNRASSIENACLHLICRSSGGELSAASAVQGSSGRDHENKVQPLNRVRVLVADDHHELLKRVTSILATEFDVVGSARNGRELLAQAGALEPDIVIVDVSMPVLNGIDAVRQLVEHGSGAKFVFLTLHEDPAFVDTCFAAGAMAYVVKKRLPMDLIIAVQEVLLGRQFVSPPLNR
jgi:DNA-binding NarL/FixJ family response regulator